MPTGMFLGEGKPGDTLEGTFEIHNPGSEPLTFQLKVGCQCVRLAPSDGVVAPGAAQQINVKLDLRKKGPDEQFFIWISTNDPALQLATYPVRAGCPKGFFVHPAQVDFGHVLKGSSKSQAITITSANPGLNVLTLKETNSCFHLKTTRKRVEGENWDRAVIESQV